MAKEKNIKTNAVRIAETAKIDFEAINYESDGFMEGTAIAHKLGQPYAQTFKTLVTKGKPGQFFVFVVPVSDELDLKKAAKAVGEKSVEMLPVKDLLATTGYVRGGCSPIGMKKAFPTVIHKSAAEFDRIMFSDGRLGTQLKMSPNDLAMLINGKFEDITR
ncbi:MAG: Cys-tRNA(Pro) deacylase [Clostridia bacterium]|nr:Cys-tRNA(Pro) deacylase [Clostridia bacterium]